MTVGAPEAFFTLCSSWTTPSGVSRGIVLQPAQPEGDSIRPESELARGRWAGSKWLLLGMGALSVVLAVTIVVLVIRRRLKARAEGDLGPISSRGSVRPGPPSTRPPA